MMPRYNFCVAGGGHVWYLSYTYQSIILYHIAKSKKWVLVTSITDYILSALLYMDGILTHNLK